MQTTFRFLRRVAAIGTAILIGAVPVRLVAQQTTDPANHTGAKDLGGIVTGKNGPEVGVWVIAETSGLPTVFAKIVVTDDQGRYLIPDLPQANYDVWVRGYGLIDSAKGHHDAGKDRQFAGGPGAGCRGSCATLSGDLLVFDAEHPG